MRKSVMLVALAMLFIAGPAFAQDRDDVEFIGGGSTFSEAVIVENTIYLSGMQGRRAGPTVEDQTRSIMEQIRDTLAEHGATMDDVVKCLVFMADLSERPRLNEVYSSFFPNHAPARSAVGVDLGGPLVEIECIAVRPD